MFTEADPEEPVRFPRRCLGCVDGRVQQPWSVTVDQVGLTDRPAPQQQQMVRVAHHPHGAQSPSNSPDRHRTVAAEIAELPGQAAGVERLRRDRPEHHRGGLDRPTPLRTGQLEFR
jgi:hypothetical protein